MYDNDNLISLSRNKKKNVWKSRSENERINLCLHKRTRKGKVASNVNKEIYVSGQKEKINI